MTEPLSVTLDDKYLARSGRVLISGVQALVRLPLMQRQRDRAGGLDTAGFISGYRGSPIGGYDLALEKARALLEEHRVHFQPGLNEDLAATAVWGSQQLENYDRPLVDGVFAIWYGKGPGVDRSLDPIKHGNYTGTHPHGGVLMVFGDDHPGKSSSIAHQSDPELAACSVPILYPATVDEFLSYGLLGIAMSRYAGCWVAMKTVNETIERTETIDLPDPDIVWPDARPEHVHFRANHYAPAEDDQITRRQRVPAALEFARANRLDQTVIAPARPRLGIVTAGKAYLDVRRALARLNLSPEAAAELGIGIYKVGMIWPLEPAGLREFAAPYEELLVVEEKREFLEDQAAKILYHLERRPRLVGKFTPEGELLLPGDLSLEADTVAAAIAARLAALGIDSDHWNAGHIGAPTLAAANAWRLPYFCSGCPHNTSTRVPEGSIALAGIGCHGMTMVYREDTRVFTHMGGEGANWIGAAPFTETKHVFQNLGDGTYYHSGILAIRAAVAAGVNITYKILYNDAVALTGGQALDGPISVPDIIDQVTAEGVVRVVLVSDTPEAYSRDAVRQIDVYHRDELDQVQRSLRSLSGVSVLIYEQTCAAEKRRRRKRGRFPDPAKRVFINPEVCEGCGDCSVQSTCMSIFPLDTELGKKRQIDQSSCNKDFSCVKGFCPSFVTVYGGKLSRTSTVSALPGLDEPLPAPAFSAPEGGFSCMIAGIGGTGVVTVGAVLAMGAMIDGLLATCYDMTGLAQKGGAVFSHLRIGTERDHLLASRIGAADADLLLAFDAMAALAQEPLRTVKAGTTNVVVQGEVLPNAILAIDSLAGLDPDDARRELVRLAGEERVFGVDANRIAVELLGDAIGGNMLLLGFALQRGLIPVRLESLEQAVRLNGVAVDFNLTALRLGRWLAVRPDAVEALRHDTRSPLVEDAGLDDRIELHRGRLEAFQNRAWAEAFSSRISALRAAEAALHPGQERLSRAAVESLARVMSYKDEYEVARLHLSTTFLDDVQARFEGDTRVRFNLAPPILSRRDPVTGHLRKREFGAWIVPAFGVLARLKFLRGTPFDPFGYTRERREERGLIQTVRHDLARLAQELSASNYELAIEIAELPMSVRGYGHVKERNLHAFHERRNALWQQWEHGQNPVL